MFSYGTCLHLKETFGSPYKEFFVSHETVNRNKLKLNTIFTSNRNTFFSSSCQFKYFRYLFFLVSIISTIKPDSFPSFAFQYQQSHELIRKIKLKFSQKKKHFDKTFSPISQPQSMSQLVEISKTSGVGRKAPNVKDFFCKTFPQELKRLSEFQEKKHLPIFVNIIQDNVRQNCPMELNAPPF